MKQVEKQAKDTIKDQTERDIAVYFDASADPNFVKKHNDDVIDRTIKKYELMRKRKQQDYVEKVRERADAVATYLKSRVAEGSTPLEKYFGKTELARLQGRRIMDKLESLGLHNKVARKGVLPGKRKVYLPGDE